MPTPITSNELDMINLKAFITLERSAASAVYFEWRKTAEKAVDVLHSLIKQGRFGEAHALADRLTMKGVVGDQSAKLEELAISAVLFGAHHATRSLYDTSFVRGEQRLPDGIGLALHQLSHMVEQGGGDHVRNELHALIQAEELKACGLKKAELEKAENSLAARLNDAVIGSGRKMIDIGANLTVSRLVSLGFLAEAMHKKIATYQVTEGLDSRTCSVCRYMHGKTFDVAREYARVTTVLGTQDPQELKSAAPWPRRDKAGLKALYAMSAQEMQSAGYGSPPYHPGCRGVLQLAGTVEEDVPLGSLHMGDELNPLIDGTKGPAEQALVAEEGSPGG